ncbi:MAG: GntR family transcriptional regulator [Gammaproteobacteria bacterium]|nr:GntR family transcriptional regulator [Gammaproteobacteria bacterium]MCP4880328.1 GntR family transcriptional regulator [Gammaproteobacteria bacterium]MDP6165612.1 GntR family transcriptional regulator [Gammaproteobacteria bacterium]
MNIWQYQPKPGTPLYKVVENYLRDQINGGELSPGDLIPSEPQLAERLNVSGGTVKKAIENLVHENLLYRHQGKGTYVSRIDFNNSLFKFFTYGNPSGNPVRIHKETPTRELRQGSEKICQRLNVPTHTELLYIERIGYRDDKPVLIEKCWWIADMVRGLEKEEVHIPDLLYAVVVDQFNLPIIRSEESLTAEAANLSTSKVLEVEPGAPLVVLHRTTYSRDNTPVEFRITRGRPDSFSYRTEIR